MAPASLVLILLATISAALMHVLWGRSWTQFIILWVAAAAGSLVVYLSGIRLPLTPLSPAHHDTVRSALQQAGIAPVSGSGVRS